MAYGEKQVFYKNNVTFTPTGGAATDFKAAAITLTENIAFVDTTTTEDNGYANQTATLSTIEGSIRVFKREGMNLPVAARQVGLLVWRDSTSNATAGNHSMNVQIGTVTRGEASVQGTVPCTIAFVGQGGWANGSWS